MADGALHFVATQDNKQVLGSIEQIKQGFTIMEQQAERSGVALDGLTAKGKSLAATLAGFAGIGFGGAALVKQITEVRSEMQNTEAMFKVFLKSGEAASSFMERLQNYAFNNVFEFSDLAQQSAQLLAFGTAQDQVIDRLDRLSNVAAGANVPLAELVQVYNKVKATNSVDSMVEKSLSAKGIRIQELLEQARGLDKGALDGVKFSFKDLDEAIKAATDEGGMYFGMMEEKMKTLGDKVGLLQDSVTNMFNEMGEELQDVLGKGIEMGSELADNWREIIEIVGGIAIAYGATKGAFALDKAFDNAQRLQALKFEQTELNKLDTATQKYTAALLKQQVAELQAAKSAGKLTDKQAKDLAQKEAELRDLENAINLQQAVDAGIMTEAEAQHIIEIQKAREAKHEYWESVRNDLDAELEAADQLIEQETANWNDPQLTSAIENVRKKKEEVANIQSKVDTNADYIQQLKDETTELQNNGQAKEAAANIEKLLEAEKEQATLVTQLQTAETELSTARKEVDNIVTTSSTASEELNAVARQQAAQSAQREAASVALSATQTTRDTIATTAATKAKRVFTVAINSAKVAMKSFFTSLKASLASNPFGWIMLAVSGLVELGMWLYKVFTAETSAEKAQNALNDAMGNAAASAENEIRQLDIYIGMLKNADKSSANYASTKQKLINQFSQYDENIRKEIDDILAQGEAYDKLTAAIKNAAMERAKQSYMSNINNTIQENSKEMWSGKDGKGGIWGDMNKKGIDGTTQGEIARQINEVLADAAKLAAADKNGNGKFNRKEIEQLFAQQLGADKYAQFKEQLGDAWKGVMNKIADYADDTAALLVQQQGIIEGTIMPTTTTENTDENKPLKDVKALLKEIYEAQTALDKARKDYAANATQENKTELESAQNTYDEKVKNYKLATQLQFQDAKTLRENLRKLQLSAEKEEIALEEKKVQDKRKLLDLQLRDRLAELDREEKEYNKNNNGGSAKSREAFNKRRETVRLDVEFDRQQLDKEFAEWKRDFERQTVQIHFDMELAMIEQQIELATNVADKIELQNELYKKQIALKRQASAEEAENAVKQKYGDETLANYKQFSANESNQLIISQYQTAKTPEDKKKVAESANLDEALLATYAEMEEIYAQYNMRLNATIQQAAQQHNAEMLKQDIDDYAAYCEEIIEAARWREEQLTAIQNGEEKNRTAAMVEKDYNAMVEKAGTNHDIDATEQKAADIVARLVSSLADVTYDQVDEAAKKFYDALEAQKAMLEEVQGMSEEDKQTAIQETEQQKEQAEAELENPLLTEEQKLELQNQIADAEQRLIYLKMTEAQSDGQMTKLTQTRRTMEDKVLQTKQASGKKTIKQQQQEQKAVERVSEALGAVSSAAKSVANTMGDVLSKKSKKALGVISDIADFGIQSIQSIQYVATNASTLMESTAVGAAGAIQTVEKASVILTIISLAVQAIMAIVNIAKKFTKNAKVNEELDDMAGEIERMKELHRDLEFQTRNSTGSQYFIDAAKRANDYTNQINEAKEAYQKSLEEEERLKRKYGSDSDKVQDQHERTQEFYEEWQDATTTMEDEWKELVDTILTTDLSGWADTLADSAIEAALDGSEAFSDIWNEALEQWERDMYKQQLKLAYENLFGDVFKDFQEKAQKIAETGGELSETDIDQFVAEMESKQQEAERITEMYRELMERRGLLTDDSDVEGSKGGFENMSQDTADELNARFTALQIEGANVVTATQAMQAVLDGIADNDRLRLASIQNMASNIDIGVTIQQNILDQTRMIAETVGGIKEDTARLKAIEQNSDRL